MAKILKRTCKKCGVVFVFGDDDLREICGDCESTPVLLPRRKTREEVISRVHVELESKADAEKALIASVKLTTAFRFNGYRTEKTIDIVTAECVFGVNVLTEFIVGLTDLFGGRSKKMQKVLRDLRVTCLDELRKEALAVGANAVIGVNLAYNELSGKGTEMLMLVASGTAVIVKLADGDEFAADQDV